MSDQELSFIVFTPSAELRELIRLAEATGAVIRVADDKGLSYAIRVEHIDPESLAIQRGDEEDLEVE